VEFRELRVVVAIADHGSVTRAAAALHQSVSSVSHTLNALEAELGVELFHRLPRGMKLTDAGEAFLGPARQTVHDAAIARGAVDEVRGVLSGTLDVAAVRAFTVPLADHIGAFTTVHPGVVVRVHPPDSEDVVATMVRSGVCEVGFVRLGAPGDLDVTVVGKERAVAVVPATHRLAGRAAIDVSDLAGEPLVAPPATSAMRPPFDATFEAHGVAPRVVAEGATHEMVLELVRAGVGCTIATDASVAPVVGRGAVALEVVGFPSTTMVLVMRKGQTPTPAARAFRDVATRRRTDR